MNLAASTFKHRSEKGIVKGYHFSGISVNLEMSDSSTKVREKSRKRPKVRERSGKTREFV